MAIGTEAIDLPRPFGPYTLTRRLAVGGMAEVYVAKTQGIGGFEKLLAIKVIHPTYSEDEQFITMLVEEAKLSVLLNHNNVVQTFDLGCTEDTYFIAMELVEGADCYRMLKALRQRKALLPLDICAYIVSAVCSALDYAHRKRDSGGNPLRIVHRDVSPQNVLVSFSGDVKLADFGIAKAALRTQDTQVGIIKGKYYYMSPEQAWGDPMDHRSDIFSAGVVLHELLTGEMLYQADNLPELLDRVRKAELRPPSAFRRDVPAELDAITMKALARRPEDRYESAHDLGQALTQFLYQHQPSFTTARVARLMSQLFADEYAAATGAPPPSQEKLLATDRRDSVTAKMTVGEYEPDPKSVIFDLRRTRDDLPSVLLNHNNVVQTFDLGCTEDTYFIAMELVEGADCYRMLKALRQRKALLPLDICAYIVSAVCSALDYAHRKRDSGGNPLRIVHRDVSPQNVLVSFSGDVKLADFGIAKAALRTQDTQVGIIKGKYYYMSPEQAWGDPMDHRSDIFSAGVVLHELLTGEMLYQADNLPELLDRVRKAELRPPSAFRRDVPAELDAITMKALARRAEDRYESAHDLGQALTQFLYQHQPSFTTARVARLMSQLFAEEYAAATGAPPPSQEKLLAADPGRRDSVTAKMTVGEYEPDPKSVIFDLRRTRDDLPTLGRAVQQRRPAHQPERHPGHGAPAALHVQAGAARAGHAAPG